MATTNPFDLLGDDDNDDPSQVVLKLVPAKKSSAPPPSAAPAQQAKPAKLPSKPLPPAQAVRESKSEVGRGGGRGSGRGYGRGRGGAGLNRDRDSFNNESTFNSNDGFSGGYRPSEEGDTGKSSERRGSGSRGLYRGSGRRGGLSNGEVGDDGERPRRVYERRSGTGRGNEVKRDGAGRGNWGTPADEIVPENEESINETEKNTSAEKQLGEDNALDANKDNPVNESEEKEPEDKEMTLEEYEKVREEKRKAMLLASKTEERKVDTKEFESMQQLSNKKDNDDVFIKLGSEKDKRKEIADKEERAKKSVSINEFLKPAEGDRYYGGRGRGRGRGARGVGGGGGVAGGGSGSGLGGTSYNNVAAPSIEDPGQFPTLGGGK